MHLRLHVDSAAAAVGSKTHFKVKVWQRRNANVSHGCSGLAKLRGYDEVELSLQERIPAAGFGASGIPPIAGALINDSLKF